VSLHFADCSGARLRLLLVPQDFVGFVALRLAAGLFLDGSACTGVVHGLERFQRRFLHLPVLVAQRAD